MCATVTTKLLIYTSCPHKSCRVQRIGQSSSNAKYGISETHRNLISETHRNLLNPLPTSHGVGIPSSKHFAIPLPVPAFLLWVPRHYFRAPRGPETPNDRPEGGGARGLKGGDPKTSRRGTIRSRVVRHNTGACHEGGRDGEGGQAVPSAQETYMVSNLIVQR